MAVQLVAGHLRAAVLQLLSCMAWFLVVSSTGCTLSRGEQWLGEGERLLPLFWLYPVELLGWRVELGGKHYHPKASWSLQIWKRWPEHIVMSQLSVGVQLCQATW